MYDLVQRWEWAARTALADQGIGHEAASGILARVQADCLESGSWPWEAFGSPQRWAAAVASTRKSLRRTAADR